MLLAIGIAIVIVGVMGVNNDAVVNNSTVVSDGDSSGIEGQRDSSGTVQSEHQDTTTDDGSIIIAESALRLVEKLLRNLELAVFVEKLKKENAVCDCDICV